jgi:hypothetical protein
MLLCRRASYSKIPDATAAFNDSTLTMGIFTPVKRATSIIVVVRVDAPSADKVIVDTAAPLAEGIPD